MPSLDVDRARALTPGCEHVVHLNHAGASLLPQPVLDAVVGHLERESRVGGYEAAAAAAGRIEALYASLARLIGARPDEIAVVDSATTAWNSAVAAFPIGAGDRIVLTRAEYGGNAIRLLRLQERTGCELVLIEDDAHGQVDLDELERELAARPVALVSLVHVPTGSGLVNPAEEVGLRCREAGVALVLDASQSVGQLPVDVDAIGCDVLVAPARKFLRGPRGVGFLYVRSSLLPRLVPMSIDLRAADWVAPDRYVMRDDARRFEQWEADIAARIGFGVAVDHALSWGLEAIAERDEQLAAGLRERMRTIPGVTVHDKGLRHGAITTCTVDGVDSTDVMGRLRDEGINTSVTVRSQAVHDLGARGLPDLLRASVHYTTTDDELDRFAAALARIARRP